MTLYEMNKYFHCTTKEIKPAGWLKKQLEIQANGLSGNLDRIWPDVQDSVWIGGTRYGWERVPYWLDGFIPLAYLLDDDGLKERAEKYVQFILKRQEEDGWICPCDKEHRSRYDVWAVFLICKVLVVYYECTEMETAMDAVEKALRNLKDHINGNTLSNWGHSRWFEALIPIYAVYHRKPEKWLEELAVTLATQGLNYKRLFQCWRDQTPKRIWTYQTHIVNLMMALKSEALFTGISGEDPNAFGQEMFAHLLQYHGSPLGYITGDECLAGKSAIHGVELCGIVEAMYSFEVLFEITGDTTWMERAERYAFNFLPATISQDMWTHQYVQMVNQIACCAQEEPPIYFTNGIYSNCFGLEPNFGCCTANFGQAWPKFALSSFYKTKEGVISAIPVPSIFHFKIKDATITIETITEYPFKDQVKYRIKASEPTEFCFDIRIPECQSATLDGTPVEAGSIVSLTRIWKEDEITLDLKQEILVQEWEHQLYRIKRGSLYFAVPLEESAERIEYVSKGVERKYPYCDYSMHATEPFGLALCDVSDKPDFHEIGEYPFSRNNPPITIPAHVAEINWGTEKSQPTVCREEPLERDPLKRKEKILYPYGATTLRMAVLPKITGF